MLIRIARLELLNNVFVALDCAGHLLLEVVELSFEFLRLPLLQAHLQDLLVKVMLHELHLEEHVARFVDSILRPVQARLVPVLPRRLVLLVLEAQGVVLRVLRVLGNDFTLVLVFNRVDDLGIDEVALRREAFDGETN